MNKEQKTTKHGGKRKGSGRPKSDSKLLKIPVCYRLPHWLVSWLRTQDSSAAVLIESALKKAFGLKPPK